MFNVVTNIHMYMFTCMHVYNATMLPQTLYNGFESTCSMRVHMSAYASHVELVCCMYIETFKYGLALAVYIRLASSMTRNRVK